MGGEDKNSGPLGRLGDKIDAVVHSRKVLRSDLGDSRSANFYDGVHVIPLRFAFAMQSDLLT